MNAWLITWEGTDRRIQDSNRIVAILNGNYSENRVEMIADALYHRTKFNAYELANAAHKPKLRNKLAVSIPGRILFGQGDLFLFARRVVDLEVKPSKDGTSETVKWTERALIGSDPNNGYAIKELDPEITKSLTRQADRPITIEPRDV